MLRQGFRYISLYRYINSILSAKPNEQFFVQDINDQVLFENKNFFKQQLSGALSPFSKIAKAAKDTIKPWPAYQSILLDFLAPLHGFFNIAKGLTTAFAGLILVIPAILFTIIADKSLFRAILPCSWVLEGIANTVRGVSQLLLSPFTYLVKIPIRTVLTLQQENKVLAESKPSIIKLVNEANRMHDEMHDEIDDENAATVVPKINSILREIDRKYCKAVDMGYPTKIAETSYEGFKYNKNFLGKLTLFTSYRIKLTDEPKRYLALFEESDSAHPSRKI